MLEVLAFGRRMEGDVKDSIKRIAIRFAKKIASLSQLTHTSFLYMSPYLCMWDS